MRKRPNGIRNSQSSELPIQSVDRREGATMPTWGGRSTGTLRMMPPAAWMCPPGVLGEARADFYGE
eukprot:7647312-Pyramimonas_sp.AAC.1